MLPPLATVPPSTAEFQCDPQAEMMLVVPGNISQGIHQIWASIDPGNALLGNPSDLAKAQAVLSSGRDDFIESCLRYLTHLASTEQNKTYLGRSPLMISLVQLLFNPSSSKGVLEMTGWLLTSLSSVDSNRLILRTYRAVAPLVHLLQHYDPVVRKQYMVLWSALLKDDACRAEFKQQQGLLPLLSVITTAEPELAQMALTLLCQSGFDAQVVKLLVDAHVLPRVLPLLQKPDEQSKRMGVIILSAISTCPDGRQNEQLFQSGGITDIVGLLQSGNPFLIEKALVILSNCSVGHHNNMDQIRLAGGLGAIVELMQAKFPAIRSCAVMTATNLIMLSENQMPFVEAGGSRILVQRLSDTEQNIAMRAAWGLANLSNQSDYIRGHLGSLGTVAHLAHMLAQATLVPEDTRKQCLKALVNLALNLENEPLFNESGIIPLLLQYSLLPDPSIHVVALWGLVNISTNDRSRKLIAESGGLQVALQILLSSQSGDTQLQCLKLLTNMTINGRCRWLLSQTPSLVQALPILAQCAVPAISEQAQAIVRNFTFPVDPSDMRDGSVLFQEDAPIQAAVAQAIEEQIRQQDKIREEESARHLDQLRAQKSQHQEAITANSAETSSSTGSSSTSSARVTSSSSSEIEALPILQTKDEILQGLASDTLQKEASALLEASQLEEETRKLEAAQAAAEESRRKELEAITAEERQRAELETQRLAEEARAAKAAADDKYHSKRTNIAAEILVTERTYVQALNMMVKKYMNPLTACLMETPQGKTPIVSEVELNSIFSTCQLLHTYHSMLLEGLERRITQWGPETLIGDYFLQMSDFLRSYSTYVNNYDHAVATLTACELRPAFKEVYIKLVTSSGELKGQSLYSYMIMPIQRIPRYILLLTDLCQKTRPDHPDHALLQKAIAKITEIAEFVDTKKAFHNDSQRMVALAKIVTNVPRGDSMIKPSRTLLQEGELYLNKQSSPFYIILFNDALVITSKPSKRGSYLFTKESSIEQYSYVNQICLIDAQLTNYKGEAFAIKSPQGEIFRFEASSNISKVTWVKNIKKALDSHFTDEKMRLRKSVNPLSNSDGSRGGSAIMSAGGISKLK